MSTYSYRFDTVWGQIAPITDEFIRETELDPDTKGDIYVQLREDTPNAKIKSVLSYSMVLKLGEKPGLQIYRTLMPIVEKAINKFSRRRETVTEIVMDRDEAIVSISVTATTMWLINLRSGEIVPPKIGAKREDALEFASNRVKVQIPRFLNGKPHLTVYVRNGNLTAFKQLTKVSVPASAKVDVFKKILHENLFSEKVHNQHELNASFQDGEFTMCCETRHEDFNVRY